MARICANSGTIRVETVTVIAEAKRIAMQQSRVPPIRCIAASRR
jgi:hypothetical protein